MVAVGYDVEDVGGSLPTRWSASALDLLLQCGLRFWFSRVAGWREPETVPMVVGTVVHGVLEDLYTLPPDERDFGLVRDLLPARVARHVPEGSTLDPGEIHAASRERLLAYVRVEPDPTAVNVAVDGLERELDTTLGGVPFIGYVDRITEKLGLRRVTDYKTGGSDPRHLPTKWRQQMLYAAALEALDYPVDEVALLFLGDRARTTVRPVYPLATQRAVDGLADGAEQAEAHLVAQRWPATASGLCRSCPFNLVCPLKAKGAPTPGSTASNEKLARRGLTRRAAAGPPSLAEELVAETATELAEEAL